MSIEKLTGKFEGIKRVEAEQMTIVRGKKGLFCPLPEENLAASHPRIFLPIQNGKAKCLYCGRVYVEK